MTYNAHYAPPLQPGALPARGVQYETVLNIVIFLMLSFSAMSIIEPSPYDFLALLAVPMWLIGGFRLHQSVMLILILWLLYTVIGFIALTPYWHEPDPRLFQIQSLFLLVTVAFFTLYFSEKTERRMNVAMSGYVVAAMMSAGVGIVAYLNIGGLGALGTMYEGRASGTFKDPNVLGSFLILAITLLAAKLLLATTRRPVWTSLGLGVFFVGLFLTFSRGAWLATAVALMLLVGFAYFRYADRKLRFRIVLICATMAVLAILGIAAVLADDATRELLLLRASVTQDYDVGETGRFGNQMRAIRTLLGQPEGFGPLRLRLTFDLDPHNSYIGAFGANFGWIGGFLWLIITGTTVYVGLRLMWQRTPVQHLAIGVVPAMIAMLMQGFQIDIDHWRHVYIAFGIVWGIEAARVRWQNAQAYAQAIALPQG